MHFRWLGDQFELFDSFRGSPEVVDNFRSWCLGELEDAGVVACLVSHIEAVLAQLLAPDFGHPHFVLLLIKTR